MEQQVGGLPCIQPTLVLSLASHIAPKPVRQDFCIQSQERPVNVIRCSSPTRIIFS